MCRVRCFDLNWKSPYRRTLSFCLSLRLNVLSDRNEDLNLEYSLLTGTEFKTLLFGFSLIARLSHLLSTSSFALGGTQYSSLSELEMVMGLSEFSRMIEAADEVAHEEGGTFLRFMSDLKSSVSDIRERGRGAILITNYIRKAILRYVKSCNEP